MHGTFGVLLNKNYISYILKRRKTWLKIGFFGGDDRDKPGSTHFVI